MSKEYPFTSVPGGAGGRDIETMASLHSPLLHTRKCVLPCPTLPFTAVEDDPHIAPVIKLPPQLRVSVQPGAGGYE